MNWVRDGYVELRERLEAGLQDDLFVGLVFEPGVLEALRGGDSLLDVEGEHFIDEVFGVGRDFVELGDAEGVDACLDLLHDLLVVLRVEGGDAGEHDVEDDSERPHVALFVVAFADDFGGDVVGLGEEGVRCRVSSRGTGWG